MVLSEAILITATAWVSQAQPILRRAPRRGLQDSYAYGSEKHGRRSGLRPRLDSPTTPDTPVARTGERALRAIRGRSPLI